MNLIKCPNNHLYNADHFPTCPHCANEAASIPKDRLDGHDEAGINTSPVERSVEDMAQQAYPLIAGWLVCINGDEYGKYYPLYTGDNTIGRGANMDIRISSDVEISRQIHAEITYDPATVSYTINVRGGVNPVYVNDRILPAASEDKVILHDRDRIIIGAHTFIFVAFCNDAFSWR